MRLTVLVVPLLLAFPVWSPGQVVLGNEFAVNTYTIDIQTYSSIAATADGGFLVVWHSRPYCFPPPPIPPICNPGQDGDGRGVFSRRFDASGGPVGGEFQVNTYTLGDQHWPSVAALTDGWLVAAWVSSYNSQSGSAIGRIVDPTGQPAGVEFVINPTNTGTVPPLPAIAPQPDAAFVVVWQESERVLARRFAGTGAPLTGEIVVETGLTGAIRSHSPRVATDAAGNFVVTWEFLDASGPGIFARRFASSGTGLGTTFQVNSNTTGYQVDPSIAVGAGGDFVVTWTALPLPGQGEILARRFSSSGSPLGTEFLVSSATNRGGLSAVAAEPDGAFLVVWTTPNLEHTVARRVRRDGVLGAEFVVDSGGTQNRSYPAVALGATGSGAAAWTGFDGYAEGVRARRLGGLFPVALTVDAAASGDSNGNGVFEAGETVAVAPSWRNATGVTQAVDGAASAFTGPGAPNAPSYTIIDASAAYGVVAHGAAASCGGQCYAMRVGVPIARPAAHWDASFAEDLTPSALAPTKTWMLHVGDSFADVPRANPFYRFIETLLHQQITGGCTATTYCPGGSTLREQMAVFVLVAREGAGYQPPACATPVFNDVPASSPFCRFIEELARRGVVTGCGNGNYCPQTAVTREQMAVFVLRTLDPALNPPACVAGSEMFADVPASSGFCKWIEELARRGVVTGCGGGDYCPGAPVSREQMGVFISAAFGLQLYGL